MRPAAVSSGRLLRELEPSAEFPLEEIVAGGRPDKNPVSSRPVDEVTKRRKSRDAERAIEAAAETLGRGRHDQKKTDQKRKDAEDHVEQQVRQVSELEADLARARNEEETARNALNETTDQHSAAAERVASAEDARAALDHP